MKRIAVTGLGAVSGLGHGTVPLWEGLRAGRSAATGLRVFPPDGHRTRVAVQVPAEGPRGTTRTAAFAVAAAREAVESAGLLRGDLAEAGIFFAGTTGGMLEAEDFYARARRGPRPAKALRHLAEQQTNSPGDAVMRDTGAGGPLGTIASSCAAGAMALEAALGALRSGEVDLALAGGADGLCQVTFAGFNSLRAVAEGTCVPFRAGRTGVCMGEGAGVLVLEPLERARARGARILAEFAGAGSSCDATHMTAPDEEGRGAAAAIRVALLDAGLIPGDIGFINAHGTGTLHNDRAEFGALRSIFGPRLADIPLAASKAVFGHLLGASGALEAVTTVLCLLHGEAHPAPGPEEVDPDLPVRLVVGAPQPIDVSAAALSISLGFGGTNAALLFRAGTP